MVSSSAKAWGSSGSLPNRNSPAGTVCTVAGMEPCTCGLRTQRRTVADRDVRIAQGQASCNARAQMGSLPRWPANRRLRKSGFVHQLSKIVLRLICRQAAPARGRLRDRSFKDGKRGRPLPGQAGSHDRRLLPASHRWRIPSAAQASSAVARIPSAARAHAHTCASCYPSGTVPARRHPRKYSCNKW